MKEITPDIKAIITLRAQIIEEFQKLRDYKQHKNALMK